MPRSRAELHELAKELKMPVHKLASLYTAYLRWSSPTMDFDDFIRKPTIWHEALREERERERIPYNNSPQSRVEVQAASRYEHIRPCAVPQLAASPQQSASISAFDTPPIGAPNRLAVPTGCEGEGEEVRTYQKSDL